MDTKVLMYVQENKCRKINFNIN